MACAYGTCDPETESGWESDGLFLCIDASGWDGCAGWARVHTGAGEPAAGEGAAPGACQGDLAATSAGGADAGQLPRSCAAAGTGPAAAPPHHRQLLHPGQQLPLNLLGLGPMIAHAMVPVH